MNDIEINIGGKDYKISCEVGQEDHIRELSRKVDQKFSNISDSIKSPVPESLKFVLLSIMAEDDLLSHANKSQKLKVSAQQSLETITNTTAKLKQLQSA